MEMKSKIKTYGDQKSSTVLASFFAVLILIVVTKVILMIRPDMDATADASYITKVFFAVAAPFFILFIVKTPMIINWSSLKLPDRKHIRQDIIFPLVISLVIIAGIIAGRFILNHIDPSVADRPYFGLYPNINGRWFYPVSVVFQELVIKSMMQENFRSFSANGNKHITVWVNAVFFAVLHMNYSVFFMIGSIVLCVFTGYLYERSRNIWGSCMIHFVIGFLPRTFGLI